MTYSEYWEKNYANENVTGADRTFGETVWNDAQNEMIGSFPCQRCGTGVVNAGAEGKVQLQCPKCGLRAVVATPISSASEIAELLSRSF